MPGRGRRPTVVCTIWLIVQCALPFTHPFAVCQLRDLIDGSHQNNLMSSTAPSDTLMADVADPASQELGRPGQRPGSSAPVLQEEAAASLDRPLGTAPSAVLWRRPQQFPRPPSILRV
jgi:hypothetical protein